MKLTEAEKVARVERVAGAVREFPVEVQRALLDDQVPLDVAPDAVMVWQLARLRDAVEHAIGAEVGYRRLRGTPWGDLGVALGVTPQAAQQRYRSVAPVVRKREGAGA